MRTPLALLSIAAIAAIAAGLTACGGPDVFDIEVGSCMNKADLEGDEVSAIKTFDCAEEHDVEAYAATDLEGDEYPGKDAILTKAEDFCMAEFESFVGSNYQESTLFFSYLYPTQESWDQKDDRQVLCLLISDEPVTGSLGGSGL